MSQSVLIIDDSPDIHDLLTVRLRPESVSLHHATDAEEGIALAETVSPDLILLDIDMPNMTGFEACQRLKSDPRTAPIPIIFLTGATQIHDKVQGFDLGAVDYVTKPFNPAELRARVRAALRTKRYQDLLSAKAQVDALTGLWNRAYFTQRLADELEASRRYGRKVSLVMVDIDHFKQHNDKFGHPFGDQVLQSIGEVLLCAFRTCDATCRYGGEEFAIILPETALEGAMTAALRIQEVLRGLKFWPKGQEITVTVSIGIASTDDLDRPDAQELLRLADEALYIAKREGRNRIAETRRPRLENIASIVYDAI